MGMVGSYDWNVGTINRPTKNVSPEAHIFFLRIVHKGLANLYTQQYTVDLQIQKIFLTV